MVARTACWLDSELIEGRYTYDADHGRIERVFLPGCGALRVERQESTYIVLETGRYLRVPKQVRNTKRRFYL